MIRCQQVNNSKNVKLLNLAVGCGKIGPMRMFAEKFWLYHEFWLQPLALPKQLQDSVVGTHGGLGP